MSKIKQIDALTILDSRGLPTIQASITLDNGLTATASVPSGASTGSREAFELRDGDLTRYHGFGVNQAISNIKTIIAPALINAAVLEQATLDNLMLKLDATDNKSKLGANAILAVSSAISKLIAKSEGLPLFKSLQKNSNYTLPVPLMNIINGGAHANNDIDIQEFMIVPHGAKSFSEAIRYGAEVFACLKKILHQQGFSTGVGDEGGFASQLRSSRHALDLIMQAINQVGLSAGKDISLAIDVAATELYAEKNYHLAGEKLQLSAKNFTTYLVNLTRDYPIISIEDGMAEQDFVGWQMLTHALGNMCQIIGDDLFVTNKLYLSDGIEKGMANAILIKPNQIGTISETMQTISLARQHLYSYIISHRSGETEDTLIADMAVATGASQIKTGSLCRSDRTAKYNRLLSIEHAYSDTVQYVGNSMLNMTV